MNSPRLAAGGHAGRTAGDEAAVGVIGESDLTGHGELVAAGSRVDGLVVGDRFQLKIFAGAAESALLAHHGGDTVSLLALRALLLARLLAVLEAAQTLMQLLSGAFLQWVTK